MPYGYTSSFTAGEISADAWDRIDIQPVAKGCEEATNLVIRIAGPLGKRRGFWRLGAVADETKLGRLIPFRRGIDDALMLEFGDTTVRVWQADGSPLLNGGVQVQFASPYSAADAQGLRYKQVVDVIYLHSAAGLAPRTLSRNTDISWTFALTDFPNGPWLPENIDATKTITATSASAESDTNPNATGAGSIPVGATVSLVATGHAPFAAGHVGGHWRLRLSDGNPGVWSWAPGNGPPVGWYALSNGRVYRSDGNPGGTANLQLATTPPTVTAGHTTDGRNGFDYRHDGAGVIKITAVANATHATGTVVSALPMDTATPTSRWSEGAYSDYRGWPRMRPELVEERLVMGATAANLDILDMTGTADFGPARASFSPGLGTGLVLDTDAMRRRLGEDSSEILWAMLSTFLIVGTAGGEHIASGGLFGEPMTPSTVAVRQISEFGSADVQPAKAQKGLFFVTTGGQTIRQIKVNTQQADEGQDCTVLVRHIAKRGFAQLAWVKQPDETLWARMADGGLAAMTYHAEQAVQGWTRQALPDGWVCEDITVLPGPGKLETLWGIASRVKGGVTQRVIFQQSQETDALFMDMADFYEGGAVTQITGLDHFAGETVRVLANGVQLVDQVVSNDGKVAVPAGATLAYVGQPMQTRFKSLKLATVQADDLNRRRLIPGAIVSIKCWEARCGLADADFLELVTPEVEAKAHPQALRCIQEVTFAGDDPRDPRILITDDCAYDMLLFSLRPMEML